MIGLTAPNEPAEGQLARDASGLVGTARGLCEGADVLREFGSSQTIIGCENRRGTRKEVLPSRLAPRENSLVQYLDRRTILCAIAAGILAAIMRAPTAPPAAPLWQSM